MALAGMTATGFAQELLYRSIASLQILSGAIGSFRLVPTGMHGTQVRSMVLATATARSRISVLM